MPSMHRHHLLIAPIALALLAPLVAACEDPPPIEPDCSGVMEIRILDPEPGLVVSEDLSVSGSAEHTTPLAIRSVTVAGVPARRDGFNFERWSATVPLVELLELAAAETGRAIVPVVALDACGQEAETSLQVIVDAPAP